MILKNAWGKYDMIWVIGDICLSNNPDFSIEQIKGTFSYLNANGNLGTWYPFDESASDFQKIIYSILHEHIKNGTETLTNIELSIQYCMRLGLFDDEYRKNKINDYIKKIKAMTKEKDGDKYYEMLAIMGGNFDNISERGIHYIEHKVNSTLIWEHLAPKYTLYLDDDRKNFYWEFYRNLRFAVTSLIQIGAFEEINT